MLSRLIIKNYALIDCIEIEFTDKLSIITGETGAGKSIILGALSLILGGRIDSKFVKNSNAKTVIEAFFKIGNEHIKQYFLKNDIDWFDEEQILRREILSNGRSRAFVNDSPINLQGLAEIALMLIDLHSQHQNLLLADSKYRLNVIDSLSNNQELLDDYRCEFKKYTSLRNELSKLRADVSKVKENEEYLRFQIGQIKALSPIDGELETLERQSEMLNNAEEIKEQLYSGIRLLSDEENSAISQIVDAKRILGKINLELVETQKNEGSQLMQRLESVYFETKDIVETLEVYLSKVEVDPIALEKIDNRINAYYELQRRFKTTSVGDLLLLKKELEHRLDLIDTSDDEINKLEKILKEETERLKKAADRLSESRRLAAENFSKMMISTASPLGMPNLKFAAVLKIEKLTIDGQDSVDFLCSFNKQQELQPISKIASGGELSRIMLSLKYIVVSKMQLPTIIFDEIDTGVSGEIADKMGDMMRSISDKIQVFAITHLPQVAAKGNNHYYVFKTDTANSTVTRIKLLDTEDRLMELARMLSGSVIDKAAIDNAKSLLERNN